MTRRALLYTEMITANAIIHGKRDQLLGFSPEEHPLALQLGGSDRTKLAEAAAIGEQFGYDEINLNVGCPSDRVQDGSFGACLMASPSLVAGCITAMQARVKIPVTVKCRIGIDDQDVESDFSEFIDIVAAAGCTTFIVHARKAWLQGLSPKENRELPPLDYGRVHRLKAALPDLVVVLNGGLTTLEQALAHLQLPTVSTDACNQSSHHLTALDGAMLGRAAYQTPWVLAGVDHDFFGDQPSPLTRHDVIRTLIPYVEAHLARGGRLHNVTRHILGLFHGEPGARSFRRVLSELAVKPGATADLLRHALPETGLRVAVEAA